LIVRILWRDRKRFLGERLPRPRQADCLVGVSFRRHGIDLRIQRSPVVGQADHRDGAGIVLLSRKQFGLAIRFVVCNVIVLITVHDAAVPGIVVSSLPLAALVLASGSVVRLRPARIVRASAVVVIPAVGFVGYPFETYPAR